MRVICIDDRIPNKEMQGILIIGESYNVIDSHIYNNITWYLLSECEFNSINNKRNWWHSDLFSKQSEIDEKDLAHAEPIESTFELIKKDKMCHMNDAKVYLLGFNCRTV